jgi:predicted  nucleic acid-binding Zn-ribbon protein
MEKAETSVAEALSQAHAALLADLEELDRGVRPSSTSDLAELRARLATTSTHVAEHFRFEEQKGYLDTVRKREPRLERAIQQLEEEHRQLLESLAALVEEAAAATSLGDPLRDRVRSWVTNLRQHEIRESDLVQDAFNLDISAED